MGDNRHPEWRVYRRGAGLLIRGKVKHPRIQTPEIVLNPIGKADTICFAVHLEPGGPYWSSVTLETIIEHFEPDVPETVRRVEIILPGCEPVVIESCAKQ